MPRDKKVWILTGDLEAFYPNVPLERAIHEIVQLLKDRKKAEAGGDYQWQLDLCAELLPLINAQLFFTYQGEVFKQRDGIVMGIACSPDIANLYAAFCENKVVNELYALGLLYYKRYIDDCIALVAAETLDQALEVVARISFEPVRILWSGSEISMDYLDVTVSIDPIGFAVDTRPYRKALSHHERVPWISSHPIDVKRGTYMSELSRLARLSSKVSYYYDAVHDANSIYLARGYPPKVINKWVKQHAAKLWRDSRELETTVKSEGVRLWVIKTQFNPALEYVNVRHLQESIEKEWRAGLDSERGDLLRKAQASLEFDPDGAAEYALPLNQLLATEATLLDRRLLFSRKATLKLGTLFNSWNRILLQMRVPDSASDMDLDED